MLKQDIKAIVIAAMAGLVCGALVAFASSLHEIYGLTASNNLEGTLEVVLVIAFSAAGVASSIAMAHQAGPFRYKGGLLVLVALSTIVFPMVLYTENLEQSELQDFRWWIAIGLYAAACVGWMLFLPVLVYTRLRRPVREFISSTEESLSNLSGTEILEGVRENLQASTKEIGARIETALTKFGNFLSSQRLSLWHLLCLLILFIPITEARTEHFFFALMTLFLLLGIEIGLERVKQEPTLLFSTFTLISTLANRSTIHIYILATAVVYLGSWLPDIDILVLGIGGHRNVLFHSGLALLLIVMLGRRTEFSQEPLNIALSTFFALGLGSHLLLDVIQYGNVVGIPGSFLDLVWLAGNGAACLLFAWNSLLKLGSGTDAGEYETRSEPGETQEASLNDEHRQ